MGKEFEAVNASWLFSDRLLGACPRISLPNEQSLIGFREILNFPESNFKIDPKRLSLDVINHS
jgi:hypothetical protein